MYQYPSFFPNKKAKQILTIHDLNFLIEKNDSKKKKYLSILQKNVDRADFLTTISQYSKKIIQENINLRDKEIQVIYNGVHLKSYFNSKQPKYCNEKKFFFSLGVFNHKKNFHVLLPLLNKYKDYNLIIAGNNITAYGEEIKKLAYQLNISDRVILPGKITDEDKFYLYQNCEAFLFPSIAEGFGMPVIEAMNIGKPIFLSSHCSLPEIGGKHAFYFSSFDKETMLAEIENSLLEYNMNSEERVESMKEYSKKFSWKYCIEEYIKIYRNIDS